MFAPSKTGLGADVQRARAALPVLPRRFAGHRFSSPASTIRVPATRERGRRSPGFTLLEMLIVVAIIGLLLVLIAPAFTYIKGGTDVTSSAYTIKDVLDTARTYAKANNTYTWVGFYEEDVSQSQTRARLGCTAASAGLSCRLLHQRMGRTSEQTRVRALPAPKISLMPPS